MSNVTCFMFIVVQFAGRRESNPDNSRIALAIMLCLRWNRKPCRPVCRSFPAVRAFRVICPMESSVLFRFATAILRRVTPAPSSPYLHSGLHLKKGDCGWRGLEPLCLSPNNSQSFPFRCSFPVATPYRLLHRRTSFLFDVHISANDSERPVVCMGLHHFSHHLPCNELRMNFVSILFFSRFPCLEAEPPNVG